MSNGARVVHKEKEESKKREEIFFNHLLSRRPLSLPLVKLQADSGFSKANFQSYPPHFSTEQVPVHSRASSPSSPSPFPFPLKTLSTLERRLYTSPFPLPCYLDSDPAPCLPIKLTESELASFSLYLPRCIH